MSIDLRLAEEKIGRLSPAQRNFIALQCQKNALVELGKRKRSNDEEKTLKSLQVKLMHSRRDMKDYDERLLIKPKPKAKSDAEYQVRRRRKLTPEQVEKDKAVQRVCMVAKRAGGLTAARMADVRAGQKKNKGSSVYSGDALRNQDILKGTFIVDQLSEGTPDSLGALGTSQCSFCGALKCCQIANIFL